MGIADAIRRQMVEGSWIRKMFEAGSALKKQYGEERVFDLSLGNPVLEPPEAFRRELRRLAKDPLPDMHRYMPNAGYPETRAAVARQLAQESGQPFEGGDIVMCVGAGGGLNVVLRALLNPGDEVVVFAPYFVEYTYYAHNNNGVPVVLPCDAGFIPDLDTLRQRITPRTKAVFINSPNNPTGRVYGPDVLAALGRVLREKEAEYGTAIYLVSDEPYRKILFDGLLYSHIYPYHPHSIAVTSHSKDLALPGERIGHIAVNPQCPNKEELVDALTFCTRTLGFVNAPALMQHLVRALQDVTVDVGDYQRKRDFLYDSLTSLGYKVHKPMGAFYMFPQSPVADDVAFVEKLQRHNVLVVPGAGFGAPGYFRISYCVEDRVLQGALDGFAAVARELGLQ